MRGGDFEDFCASRFSVLKPYERTDVIKRKSEFASAPDEAKPVGEGAVIESASAFRPRRRRHQSDFFVIADRLDVHAGLIAQPPDCQIELVHHP